MNTPQNLPTAFPFWGSAPTTGLTGDDDWAVAAAKQTFRMNYCNVEPRYIALQCRFARMLPFIVERPTTDTPTVIYLAEKDATEYDGASPVGAAKITDLLTLGTFDYDGKHYIEHPGQLDISPSGSITVMTDAGPVTTTYGAWVKPGGLYYLILEFADTKRLYSELIQIEDFPEFSEIPDSECQSRIRIECVNNCAVGDIPPTVLAAQKLFIYHPTSQPSYLTDKSVATDGKKQEKLLFATVKKRWRIAFYAPETVADFCSLIPLFTANPSGVIITDQYGVSGAVKDVTVEISWPGEMGDCLALIEIFFTRDYTAFENCC